MKSPILDVYVDAKLVGTLAEEAGGCVFTYPPDVPAERLVSLLMPVRAESYVWKGLHPFFQMNLPEGYKKDLIRQGLGAHADVTDMGLLALTGANSIGRVQVVPRGASLEAAIRKTDMAALLASADSRENLLRLLEEGITEGVSGVMPKAFARPDDKATVWTDEFILKTGFADIPWLSLNEYLCLEVARHAGLDVPETTLSADGQVLAIRRFDRPGDGRRLAVEDYCALKGLDPVEKYRKGTLEDLARLSATYIGRDSLKENARKLHTLHLLNYALRNADAHLKNFAVTYTSTADVRLAPVYDIVTVTIYPRYRTNPPALPLYGKRVWASGKLLMKHGGAWLGLSKADMTDNLGRVSEAVQKVVPRVAEFAERFPGFREVGKLMLDAWAQGLEDIKADAVPGKSVPPPLRDQSGLSDPNGLERRKAPNPYANPDGAFGYKAR
ncbi:type II toxin-antitoxin system HipA family toxin [Cupriavidus sp. IDO]|uniref:type II toxin-antitoxin system HipA family toxin n=1 Tax=Cupriavidus sp. IDO TaxID=1539142 RepID=UPI00057958B7|nr:type II toxin-antitoxin system HipA family toxin [Cupriavidus sp. IDO]KWR90587.1 phosphatidylinositol kinase [Cupriavidus sp. IDO]